MKKLISAVTAIILTVAMAASAGAADYVNPPQYTLPSAPAAPSAPSKPSAPANPTMPNDYKKPPAKGTDISNPHTVLTKNNVADAIADGEAVYASYEQADIKSNAIAALARTNLGQLKVITKRYTATIDSSSVTEAKDISLAVKMTKNTKRGAMILRTEQEGEFGCTVTLTISAKYYSQCGVDLNKANVYYIDPVTKKVTNLGKVQLDSEGNISLSMTTGGKYIIM